MKNFLLIMTFILLTSCAAKSTIQPLISEESCKNTCIHQGMEMKDYDDEKGCYCGNYVD